MKANNHGFTLIELMIVMIIMGVLAVIGVTAFMSSQIKGRDATRKGNLKAIANTLELYYNDKGSYPSGDASGNILGCMSGGVVVKCDNVNKTMTDGLTVYMATVPADPVSTQQYFYLSNGKQFQLYAHLENSQDPQLITPTAAGTSCGSACNFGISSGNTNP